METLSLRAKAIVLCGFFVLSGTDATAQEFPPPGWSIRYSTNSFYLTRADLPTIQIAVVSDIRPDLSQDEKFENMKGFFAERAGCPSLANAETTNSFAGYSANSAGAAVRCRLIAMGHWQEGGLQAALMLNEEVRDNAETGGVADEWLLSDEGYVGEKLQQTVVDFFTMRYQIGERGLTVDQVREQLSAEGYATMVPEAHRPVQMRALLSSDRSLTSGAVLLYPRRGTAPHGAAVTCADWDPALFEPYLDAFATTPSAACDWFYWRWQDEEQTIPEFRAPYSESWNATHLTVPRVNRSYSVGDTYFPFEAGDLPDIRIGVSEEVAEAVLDGSQPVTDLDPNALVLRPDGRFAAGLVLSATVQGGRTAGPVRGEYSLDGHGVTLLLESGRVVYGVAGWLPVYPWGSESLESDRVVNLNGLTFSN